MGLRRSGVPVGSQVEQMKPFADYANQSVRALDRELTKRLRDAAKFANWPPRLANVLRVEIRNDNISVSYPSNFAQEIEDLEYGTGTTTARPVFRKFASAHKGLIENALEESSVDYLFDTGALP